MQKKTFVIKLNFTKKLKRVQNLWKKSLNFIHKDIGKDKIVETKIIEFFLWLQKKFNEGLGIKIYKKRLTKLKKKFTKNFKKTLIYKLWKWYDNLVYNFIKRDWGRYHYKGPKHPLQDEPYSIRIQNCKMPPLHERIIATVGLYLLTLPPVTQSLILVFRKSKYGQSIKPIISALPFINFFLKYSYEKFYSIGVLYIFHRIFLAKVGPLIPTPFFIRHHLLNGFLLQMLLNLCEQMYWLYYFEKDKFQPGFAGRGNLRQTFVFLCAVIPMLVQAARGKYQNIPFLSENAEAHTGLPPLDVLLPQDQWIRTKTKKKKGN